MQKRRTGDEKMENTELYIKILAEYYAEHGELEREVDGTQIVQDQCYGPYAESKRFWKMIL